MLVFVDTNILIYAHDSRDTTKQLAAQAWLNRCWRGRIGRVSVQVLNEFYVKALRILGPESRQRARAEVRHLSTWQPWVVDESTLEASWTIADQHSLSHWDSLIVASAVLQGCDTLLSEDMQHGKCIDGVKILNPFVANPDGS